MLDRWWTEVIRKKEVDGFAEFKKILEDPAIRLDYLTQNMKPLKPHLTIGLPATHPELPQDLLKKPMKTASLAVVSNQFNEDVCASHSVARAVVEILHDKGFDSNQQKITEALVDSHKIDKEGKRKPKDPNEFDKYIIKINIVKQVDPEINREITVELKVQTQWAEVAQDF